MKKILVFGLCLLLLLPLLSGCRFKQFLSAVSGNQDDGNAAPQGTSGSSAEFSDAVTALDIEWAAGKVEIVYTDGKTVKIEETAKLPITEEERMVYALENGVLTIHYCAAKLMNLTIPAKTLTVTLPEGITLTDAGISMASAELSAGKLPAEKVTVSSASGDVELTTEAKRVTIDTASGDVKLAATAKQVKIDTASGRIDLTHTGNAEKIELDSASGDMKLNLNTVDELETESASGKLELNLASGRELDLETTSGDISCVLQSGFSDCEIVSTSGEIRLQVPENSDFTADIHTASGDIDYDMPLSKQGKRYVAGNGGAELTLSTASGDIQIRSKR